MQFHWKWFEQIMTRETPFLDAVWKPLQYLQWNTSLSAVGSKNDKQTDVKNKWPIIALWRRPLCNLYLMNNIMK